MTFNFNENLKNQLTGVKCSYTRAFIVPDFAKKFIIRSYNRNCLETSFAKNQDKSNYNYEKRLWNLNDIVPNISIKSNSIGVLTGYWYSDGRFVFLQIKPLFCNRAEIAYVRARDVDTDIQDLQESSVKTDVEVVTDVKPKSTTKPTQKNRQDSNGLLKMALLGWATYELFN